MIINDAAAHKKQRESLPPEKKVNFLETNAAAHKKQRKSLSPDNKVQILNKNADAHKKKQESLSPKDKDLFAKKNTAAQHNIASLSLLIRKLKYIQKMLLNTKKHGSFSPEQKGQVMTIDAAHTKDNISCFPWRKK
jgi:hypothetical protein